MARIPLQTANRSLDTGSVVQYPSGSPIGAALESAGNTLQSVALRIQQKQDQKDDFDARIRETEFTAAQAGLEDQAVQNAPEDAAGLHDGVVGQMDPISGKAVKPGSFDTLFDQYKAKMPASKQADFEAKREVYRLQSSNRLAGLQYQGEQTYYKVQIQKTQDGIINSILAGDPNDTATYEQFRQRGIDIIEKSGLPPLAKDVAKTNWEANASETLFKLKLEKDPAFAANARGALGLAPVEAPSGPVTSSRLVAAVRQVESSGNPNAESAKGASGSMQVMPATGREIARELGDTNFPMRGTDEQVKAYLKSPGVSERYGEHYLDKMLRRYNGDTAAALVAYNGGPERADKWLKAGRDDNVIPAETSAYYKKVLRAAGAGTEQSGVRANVPALPAANSFLKTRLVGHSADHIDNLKPEMQQRLAALLQAAPPEVAGKLGIYSGARTVARQKELWDAAVKRYGSPEAARKWVAPPGRSNHNHGQAADLSYNGKSLKNAPPEVVKWLHDNAGAYGLKFPLANENWHIELDSTRGGRGDPAFSAIPPDRRLVLANQADVALGERQRLELANAKADYTAYKDSVQLQIVQGGIKDEAIISSDPRLDDGDKASLITAVRNQNEKYGQIQSDLAALSSKTLALDPYSSKDKTRADNLFSEVAGKLPPEKTMAIASEIIQQTGVVPQPVVNDLRRGLTSTNVQDVISAAQSAQRISQFDPALLGRRDGGAEVQKAADDFGFYVNRLNLSPEEAARRMMDANSPDKKFTRKALEPAAKEFVKLMGEVDLAGEFDKSGVFGTNVTLGMTPGQELGIKADFIAIAEDQFYAANGDPDLAKNRALEEMKRLYGTTEFGVGGLVVVKHPPERYWPKQKTEGGPLGIGADPFSYAKTQLNQELTAISPDYQPDSVQLVTTPETDAMVKRGEMPGYAVMWKDANGVLQTMPGKLWRPDPSKIQAIDAANQAAEDAKAMERARSNQEEQRLRAQIQSAPDGGRGASLDAFIGGPNAPLKPEAMPPAAPQSPRQQLQDQVEGMGLLPTPGSAM
jgi:hypothetical protein